MSSPTHDPAQVAKAPDEGLDHPGTGRPVVLEPTPPGLWGVLLGVGLAALAPLFGFLIGGVLGRGDAAEGSFDPLALSLFIGIVVGGFGVLLAVVGGRRLWGHYHQQAVDEHEATTVEAATATAEDDPSTPAPEGARKE